jgi:hypothetical protein
MCRARHKLTGGMWQNTNALAAPTENEDGN